MSSFAGLDPVQSFLEQYGRSADELFDEERMRGEAFAGEAEFIQWKDEAYQQDKHWAFELRPERTALIVVDLQEDFVNPANTMCVPEAYRQVPRVSALIAGCREVGIPIVFTEHTIAPDCSGGYYEWEDAIRDGATKEGHPNTSVYADLAPQPGDRIIGVKHTYDSFAGTDLDFILRDRKVETVIICGTLTNYCCEATARSAFSLHYNVVFGSDVTATNSAFAHEATLRTMRYGYARVLDHQTILRLLRDGDELYVAAKASRDASAPPHALVRAA